MKAKGYQTLVAAAKLLSLTVNIRGGGVHRKVFMKDSVNLNVVTGVTCAG
jgi:hypothetical protein